MKLTKLQKDYVRKYLSLNLGSHTTISKDAIINFCETLGLEFKKNLSKDDLVNLLFSNGYEDKFYEKFANRVLVSYWDAAKLNNLTNRQLNELEQLGIIEPLLETGYKDSTLYPLSILGYEENELLDILNNKNKTDFRRARLEIKDDDDVQRLVSELSSLYEIENVSKIYPHRDGSGSYIYLSIRPLDNPITNDDYKNEENARLKIENTTLKNKIENLKLEIYKMNSDVKESEAYKSLLDRYNKQKIKIRDVDVLLFEVRNLKNINEEYKNKIVELEEKINEKSTGGRPKKFTEQEMETMKMYRLQGKSIRAIAEIFGCSSGLVHKIINQ